MRLGLPVGFRITPGQAAEYGQAITLLENRETEAVIADKGYDSAEIFHKRTPGRAGRNPAAQALEANAQL